MWVITHFGDIVNVLSYFVSGAAAIAALTPTPKDDAAIAGVRKFVDILGFNFGFAKNVK